MHRFAWWFWTTRHNTWARTWSHWSPLQQPGHRRTPWYWWTTPNPNTSNISRRPHRSPSPTTWGNRVMYNEPRRVQKTQLHQPPTSKDVPPRESSGGRESWRASSCNVHGDMKPGASPGTPQHGEIAWKSSSLPVWAFFSLLWECLWQWMKQNCTKALSEQNKAAHMRSALGIAIAL